MLEKPLGRGTAVTARPPLRRGARLRGPFTRGKAAAMGRTAGGLSWPIKGPPKGPSDPAPEMTQQIHSVARDSVKLAPAREARGHSHPAQSVH